jgi:hypothetical protein
LHWESAVGYWNEVEILASLERLQRLELEVLDRLRAIEELVSPQVRTNPQIDSGASHREGQPPRRRAPEVSDASANHLDRSGDAL